jgi:hypothetical protein
MGRRADPERIRHANMTAAVIGIRDQLRLDTEDRLELLRTMWPELADRIEEAVALIDW